MSLQEEILQLLEAIQDRRSDPTRTEIRLPKPYYMNEPTSLNIRMKRCNEYQGNVLKIFFASRRIEVDDSSIEMLVKKLSMLLTVPFKEGMLQKIGGWLSEQYNSLKVLGVPASHAFKRQAPDPFSDSFGDEGEGPLLIMGDEEHVINQFGGIAEVVAAMLIENGHGNLDADQLQGFIDAIDDAFFP